MADSSGTTGEQRESPGTSGQPRRRRTQRLKLILAAGFAAIALVNFGFWYAGRVRIGEQTRFLRAQSVLKTIEADIRDAILARNLKPEDAASRSVEAIPASILEQTPLAAVHVRSKIQQWTTDTAVEMDDDSLRNDDRILVWAEVTGRSSDERVFIAVTTDQITQTMTYIPRGEFTAIKLPAEGDQ